ncbi:MAG TPA: thioesterase family protein [Cryomorphaceae bacterium]|nr:thioesterase family protein [Cryomorphaceae bacterium]
MNKPGYPIHIRYNDLDTYGHVNNAVYITYLEEGRTKWFQDKVKENWEWDKQGILLARHEINYQLPVFFNDELRIVLWISSIGSKSFEVSFKMIKRIGSEWKSCTHGKSTAVCFDYRTQKTIEIPDEWLGVFKDGGEEPEINRV